MSLARKPHQKWNSWDQLMQEDPRVKRSSNEVVLLLYALCAMHYTNYRYDLRLTLCDSRSEVRYALCDFQQKGIGVLFYSPPMVF